MYGVQGRGRPIAQVPQSALRGLTGGSAAIIARVARRKRAGSRPKRTHVSHGASESVFAAARALRALASSSTHLPPARPFEKKSSVENLSVVETSLETRTVDGSNESRESLEHVSLLVRSSMSDRQRTVDTNDKTSRCPNLVCSRTRSHTSRGASLSLVSLSESQRGGFFAVERRRRARERYRAPCTCSRCLCIDPRVVVRILARWNLTLACVAGVGSSARARPWRTCRFCSLRARYLGHARDGVSEGPLGSSSIEHTRQVSRVLTRVSRVSR